MATATHAKLMNDHSGKPKPFTPLTNAEHKALASGLRQRLRSPVGRWLLFGTVVCIVALFGSPFPILVLDLNPAFTLVPITLSLVGLLEINKRLESLRRDTAIEYRLRAQICPSCTYGLAGVPAQPSGLTICPECAAAWRMNQTGTRPSNSAN